jgi:hypothetical protein
MTDFVSAFKPLYDNLLVPDLSPAAAVQKAVDFEASKGLSIPTVYASTAITSGGHRRDESLPRGEAIAKNNASGTMIATALQAYDAPLITPINTMLPTELGHVPNWSDSQYILFYFSWLSGLTPAGTTWLEQQLEDPAYAGIITAADEFEKPNEERWPYYRTFVEITLTKLALAESRPGGKRSDGCEVLLQLVDVEYSLGCKSEQIYADVRGLDRIAPTFGTELAGPLAADRADLLALKATVGTTRQPVELVPILLRRD